MNSSGLALINIDEAPISLASLKFKEQFDLYEDIKDLII